MDGTHFAKYLAHSQMTVLEEVVEGWLEKYMYLFLGCNLLLCLPFCCDMFLEVSKTENLWETPSTHLIVALASLTQEFRRI